MVIAGMNKIPTACILKFLGYTLRKTTHEQIVTEQNHKNNLKAGREIMMKFDLKSIEFNTTDPHWLILGDAFIRQCIVSPVVQVMACSLLGAKLLSEPMLTHCHLDPSINYNINWIKWKI